jgi:hypothetical protein
MICAATNCATLHHRKQPLIHQEKTRQATVWRAPSGRDRAERSAAECASFGTANASAAFNKSASEERSGSRRRCQMRHRQMRFL